MALTGNPNCGKTTLFNALTGLRAKVGNYAGVTVERKEGRLQGTEANEPVTILDLPGTYSLSPQSLDEKISRDVLFHRLPDIPAPRLVVVVVDASNLERNLYYATQVIELGYPTLLALNMIDVAAENGQTIDAGKLSGLLGIPALPVVASTGEGVPALRSRIIEMVQEGSRNSDRELLCELKAAARQEVDRISHLLPKEPLSVSPRAEALLLLTDAKAVDELKTYEAGVRQEVAAARERLERLGLDWRSVGIEGRYQSAGAMHAAAATASSLDQTTLSDRLDRVFTHKLWGMLIFVTIMALMFQSIFSLAQYPMEGIEKSVDWMGRSIAAAMPPGDLRSLLVDGVVAGVGAVVVFLPQICLLFLFIGLLEDTGYMARAAFLMDRLMSKVGLHGKSFIPMLSSFACAIPGIMATRTIETPKDRLVTILVAPLMSCSARLPVYTLLIATCIPDRRVLGFLKLPGLTMLAMYLLGIVVALLMAWLFKKTLLKGETPLLIMELPPYRQPVARVILRHMWDRSQLFLKRAGTVILGISILLWFLASYPRYHAPAPSRGTLSQEGKPAEVSNEEQGAQLRHSFAGRAGRLLEPVIAPLGFDWKMGIGIIASFAAREVFNSTMATVYNMGKGDSPEETQRLEEKLRDQKRPDGTPVYTPLVAVTLMVFYVFALQCVSTVAIVRRETNSWKWPLFQWFYMGLLAWVLAFVTYQGGRLLGFG